MATKQTLRPRTGPRSSGFHLPMPPIRRRCRRRASWSAAGACARPRRRTTVRTPDGKPQVLDGPYAETKEQLGGYYIVDVPDLDAAISWAMRCPAASHGAVEVRPIWIA